MPNALSKLASAYINLLENLNYIMFNMFFIYITTLVELDT